MFFSLLYLGRQWEGKSIWHAMSRAFCVTKVRAKMKFFLQYFTVIKKKLYNTRKTIQETFWFDYISQSESTAIVEVYTTRMSHYFWKNSDLAWINWSIEMISINCFLHLSFSGLPDSVLSICWELPSTQPLFFSILFSWSFDTFWFFLNYVIVRAELIDLYFVHITGYLGFLQLSPVKNETRFPSFFRIIPQDFVSIFINSTLRNDCQHREF